MRYSLLSVSLLLLASKALGQTIAPAPEPASDSVAYAPVADSQKPPSPVLPWWLPNAQECAAIRAEEIRTAPREARRRTRSMRHWAEEQPEPVLVRP